MLCKNCNAEIADGSVFCPVCGASQTGAVPVQQVVVPDYDHTAEFDPKDVSENKITAMLPYLFGLFGVLIAIIAAKESKYAGFHVRVALRLTVVEVLVGIVSAVLCFTFIVPFAGLIALGIIFVLRVIAFIQVCGGKAKEPAIIRNLKFLY